ncbi:MAG: ABC transporter ATP-binding protein/permease [Clostridia bacterium]|nr:ABC transporter ATP-binding protein/permease [Clostridia bacterium]
MLKLVGITKEYPLGNEEKAVALKGIDLEFRRKEFVSVLGHSGCGKTTLLNIIGGLDRYTTGDLFINGVSTKRYKDKDWDTYRNHSVGFVFQTYNLIMHLTVIENVELALTLVGVDRKERHERARQALEAVGLKGEENKRPNQLSGGQMQRVAIARAIINNPEILLADEPTGALDSDTSVQIMDILAELSKDRLIIMVTHNPELAEQYSTRIVRLTDGKVVGDTNPFTEADAEAEAKETDEEEAAESGAQPDATDAAAEGKKESKVGFMSRRRRKKERDHTSMSYKSALLLSGKNLLTKRARTTLTAIAGSIGIIGIAIVLALSSGFSSYVNATAENSLSQYPLTIQGSSMSMSSLVSIFMGATLSGGEGYEAYPDTSEVSFNPIMGTILGHIEDIIGKNDIKGLKAYLDDNFNKDWGTVKYDYDITMHIYTDFDSQGALNYYKINPYAARVQDQLKAVIDVGEGTAASTVLGGLSKEDLVGMFNSYSSMFNVWDELSTDQKLLESQYELIGGSWPSSPTDVVLVVDKYNHIDDFVAFALGLSNPNDAGAVIAAGLDTEHPENNPLYNWAYTSEQLMEKLHYQLMLESSYYSFNEDTATWEFVPYLRLENDMTDAVKDLIEPTQNGVKNEDCRAVTLNVSGVIRMREGVSAGSINGNIAYTKDLVNYMMQTALSSDLLKAQRAMAVTYKGRGGDNSKADKIEYYMSGINAASPITGRTLLGTAEYYYADAEGGVETYHDTPRYTYAEGVTAADITFLEKSGTGITFESKWGQYGVGSEKRTGYDTFANSKMVYHKLVTTGDDDDYYGMSEADVVGELKNAEYCEWLHKLGYAIEEEPYSVSIFASSFENKDKILKLLDDYSETEGGSELHYNDTVGTLMSGITLIIQAITYVLIAFSSISLIVSSIMIAIITYTSVMERTKEIGILRSIGARKKDITRVFNSETFIIGLMSGLLASFVTWVLSIPVNAILYGYTKIAHLAVVAWWHPVLLVGLSVLLTAIAGFIPSRIAAHKDPVLALRSE